MTASAIVQIVALNAIWVICLAIFINDRVKPKRSSTPKPKDGNP